MSIIDDFSKAVDEYLKENPPVRVFAVVKSKEDVRRKDLLEKYVNWLIIKKFRERMLYGGGSRC